MVYFSHAGFVPRMQKLALVSGDEGCRGRLRRFYDKDLGSVHFLKIAAS